MFAIVIGLWLMLTNIKILAQINTSLTTAIQGVSLLWKKCRYIDSFQMYNKTTFWAHVSGINQWLEQLLTDLSKTKSITLTY